MAAKEKSSSRWSAWLAPILFLLVAVAAAPYALALTCGALQTRAWEKTPAPLESRPVESLQLLNLHQRNGGAGYDDALGSPLAAENATPVIGRLPDTGAYANTPGYEIMNPTGWSPEGNAAWIQSHIDAGNSFLLASPITESNILSATNASGFTVYADELSQILNSGYTWQGNYLLPP